MPVRVMMTLHVSLLWVSVQSGAALVVLVLVRVVLVDKQISDTACLPLRTVSQSHQTAAGHRTASVGGTLRLGRG